MLPRHLAAAVAAIVLGGAMTTACAGRSATVTSTAAGDVEEPRWSAHLLPRGNPPLSGSVVITPSSTDGQMVVVISMQGPPSATGALAWQLERGVCGSSGTLVGTPGDYAPVVMRADGSGEATATISEPVPRDGAYRVRVFTSRSSDARLVACGDFTRRQL